MDIGFIGLGNMGAPMARRLVEAGHHLTVYDTRQESIGNLTALGAVAARSPAEVADAAETVMASLPTPDIVLAVATGARGVIEGKRVRRFVDLSTTGSVMAQRIFALMAARNIVQIDSPVSGGVTRRRTRHAGGDGVGPARRCRGGRASALGDRQGLFHRRTARRRTDDEARQQRPLGDGGGGDRGSDGDRGESGARSAHHARRDQRRQRAQHGERGQVPRCVLPGTFDVGFTAGLMTKDVKLFLSESAALGVPTQVIEAVARLLQMTCDELGSDTDLSTVVRPVEKRAGVEVRAPRS